MLEHIKQLELAGSWAELERLAETLPQGDALARVHLALSKLAEDRATTGAEYRVALEFARKAIAAGEPGSLMHTWALGRAAALLADLGYYPAAEKAACAFLDVLEANPKAEALAPWVRFALGRVRANQGRFVEAISLYRQAKSFSAEEFAERIQLAIVWALAQAGRIREAVAECPARVEYVSTGLLHAATAIILAKAGDWLGARAAAKAALPFYAGSEFRPCDLVEAAELLLVVKAAARHVGSPDMGAVWFEYAAMFAGWYAGTLARLLPTLPREGGVQYDEAASPSRGLPTGYKRCGLRGVCG